MRRIDLMLEALQCHPQSATVTSSVNNDGNQSWLTRPARHFLRHQASFDVGKLASGEPVLIELGVVFALSTDTRLKRGLAITQNQRQAQLLPGSGIAILRSCECGITNPARGRRKLSTTSNEHVLEPG
ncbi:hypothetical protein D3C76_628690 [compost metagenome]